MNICTQEARAYDMARNFKKQCPPQFQFYKSENKPLLMPLTYTIGWRGQSRKFWKFFFQPFTFFLSYLCKYLLCLPIICTHCIEEKRIGLQLILWLFSFYLVNFEKNYKIIGISFTTLIYSQWYILHLIGIMPCRMVYVWIKKWMK